jgi:hypothetical protein
MSYRLQQQVALSTVVEVSGVPTDATVTLTVKKPDGSTVGPAINHDGVGLYSSSILADQLGYWSYSWLSSGAAVGRDDGQFYVTTSAVRVISLEELKKHLNMDLDLHENDDELEDFIDASQDLIVDKVGPVLPTVYTETRPAGKPYVLLTHRPVLSITSVSENADYGTPAVVGVGGWKLDGGTGVLTRLSTREQPQLWRGGYSGVDVTYTAGLDPVPAKIRLATKELTAHLWRQSQLGRARRTSRGPEEEAVPATYALPYRVAEMLGRRRAWVI